MNTSRLVMRCMVSLRSHSSHCVRLHMLPVKTGWLDPQPVMLQRSKLQRLQHQDPPSRFLLTSSVNDYKSPLIAVSPPLPSSLLCSPLFYPLFLSSLLLFSSSLDFSGCSLFSSSPLVLSSPHVHYSFPPLSILLSTCPLPFSSPLVLYSPVLLSSPIVLSSPLALAQGSDSGFLQSTQRSWFYLYILNKESWVEYHLSL